MNTSMRNVIYRSISCSLFCTVIMAQQKALSTKQRSKADTPLPQIINAASHSAPITAAAVQATAAQQILNGRNSNSITDTSPVSNLTANSLGTWVDTWYTKVNDNIWGHETMVLEDIKKNKIAADTDGLHRIDRAIDACIKENNYKILVDLIEACAAHKITINPSHISKTKIYFTGVEKKCKELRQGLSLLEQDIIKKLADVSTVESEDEQEQTVKPAI